MFLFFTLLVTSSNNVHYSIAIAIVSSIDLTSLDSLARTNRATYSSLIQFRGALLSSTLRCSNEAVPLDPEETLRYRARAIEGTSMSNTAKASSCARDMVSECRRCNIVICRVSIVLFLSCLVALH